MPDQQNSTQTRSPHTVERSSGASASSQDFKHYISHLLSISEDLCGQTHGVAERLCQEVAHITQGCAQLVLRGQESAKASPLHRAITFSVHYRHRGYGTLFFISDSSSKNFLTDLEDLAQTCGCILYLLENTALVHVKGKRYDTQTGKALTKRSEMSWSLWVEDRTGRPLPEH